MQNVIKKVMHLAFFINFQFIYNKFIEKFIVDLTLDLYITGLDDIELIIVRYKLKVNFQFIPILKIDHDFLYTFKYFLFKIFTIS
jgi:hypothetical protein